MNFVTLRVLGFLLQERLEKKSPFSSCRHAGPDVRGSDLERWRQGFEITNICNIFVQPSKCLGWKVDFNILSQSMYQGEDHQRHLNGLSPSENSISLVFCFVDRN